MSQTCCIALALLALAACDSRRARTDAGQSDGPPVSTGRCPCAAGSYCDLATDTCLPGCLADDQCAAGQYCEPASRRCSPGCRGDADCGPFVRCEAHACVDPCGACADDGNPCTEERCDAGTCTHPPRPDETSCTDDANVCTSDVCMDGACVHAPAAGSPTCADDSNVCTRDVCAGGACTHVAGELAPCGWGGYGAFCLDASCQTVRRACVREAGGTYTVYPGGTSYPSCRCSGSSLYTGSGGISCSSCASDPAGNYFACF